MPIHRAFLAAVAVLACLPYVGLKVLWLAGSDVGLDDPSVLDSGSMTVANVATLLMELSAAALAVLLVLPVGRRIPAGTVQVPMFVGTGLLGTILLAVPLQLALGSVASGSDGPSSDTGPIEGWVFTMVYTGFSVLGICLLTIFVLHSWDRWIRPGGWTTPMGRWSPVPTRRRVLAIGHGLVLVGVTVAELVLMVRADLFGGNQVVFVLLAVAACAGIAAVALGVPSGRRGTVPLVLAYVGSAGVAAWGVYLAVVLTVPNPLNDDMDVPSGLVVVALLRGVAGALVPLGLRCLRPGTTVRPASSDPTSGPGRGEVGPVSQTAGHA